jgi:hypothetical protein
MVVGVMRKASGMGGGANQSAGRIGSMVVCMGRGESSRGCWKRLAGLGARRVAIDKESVLGHGFSVSGAIP